MQQITKFVSLHNHLQILLQADAGAIRHVSGTHLVVVGAMFDFLSIQVDRVVVIARVHDKASPFPPPGRDVAAVVLVQVLAKISCNKHTCHFNSCRSCF